VAKVLKDHLMTGLRSEKDPDRRSQIVRSLRTTFRTDPEVQQALKEFQQPAPAKP
jgi:hypothetical protein